MSIIITTLNAQQENGTSRLDKYTFSGNNGRKFFRLKNTGPGAVSGLNLSLTNIGGSGGYKLFPSADISPMDIVVDMSVSDEFNFSVDYDSSLADPILGGSTGVILTSDQPIYTLDDSGATTSILLLGPSTPITFVSEINSSLTKRELGPLLSQDREGNYQVTDSSRKITEDETSFGIVRTNPKLTGNIKLTVDSNEDIWLNSIDAVKELSDDKYKKYRIGKNSSYATDISRFFDNGTTPPEIVFSLYQEDTQYTSTKRNLSEQYDRFYQYGVTELKSKFYEEDFSFFAPLYLKTEIPDYFVIFRTDGPVNKFSYESSNFADWQNAISSEILTNSKIIKTFDLGENTPIGAYLRNLVNHSARKETDLTVSYQRDGYTYFNGIAYNKGSFAQMGELLFDYYNQENPLINVEEFITQGFERNKIISSHVINLEFLFDDVQAENYSINRYFGLYVNAIDLATFTLSEEGLQTFSRQINQLPFPRKGIDGSKISQKSFTQTNPDGISVFVDNNSIERTVELNKTTMFTSRIESLTQTELSLIGDYSYRIKPGDLIKFYSGENLIASINATSVSYDNNLTIVSLDGTTFSSPENLSLSNVVSISNLLTCDFYTEEKYRDFYDSILDNSLLSSNRFFYLKDNQGDLHSVLSSQTRYFNFDTVDLLKTIEVKIKDEAFDMSKLGGFSALLTQTDAKVLDQRGRSSLSVEILDYFDPNDYLEISWHPNSTVPGFPTRWRAMANDGYLNPGESLPSTTIASDNAGEYYLSYFHSGDNTINLDNFVASISKAFNNFEFKNFEVAASGNFLHFRSTQDGVSSDNMKFSFSLSQASLNILGTEATSTGEVYFMGGSDRKFTRCRISTEAAEGMLTTEYVSTKGSFSLPKVYNVLENKIVFSPYMEEPIYDSAGKLTGFKDLDTYKIITVENENFAIQLTSDSKMTTYELFKPSFGILSVMPLRDFDMDFFYSEYNRSYTPELIRYFGRFAEPATITDITGSTYSFSVNYDFGATASMPFLVISPDGATPPILHNRDMQFVFGPGATTASLQIGSTASIVIGPTVGDTVLFVPDEKHAYFSDLELSKFKGFLSLSGIVSSEDEELFKSLENKWDPTRFTFQSIVSEYDRLEENFLKTLVLKSRVVPYINKWVSPQGKDIRDNQYRLNYHRSFGNTNFSPSAEMFVPDPRFHTHEWPYISSVPDDFPIAQFPQYAFSYMFEGMTDKYDFTSLEKDWFSIYFTSGYPTEIYKNGDEYISANIEPAEKYSFFNYEDHNDTTSTLFRGYKFIINEIDSKGNVVNLSSKYNNYRFSAIIETLEENMFAYEDPISYTTIVNEEWKFILLKISVKTSTYRFSQGALGYTDLYTLFSKNEKSYYEVNGLEYVEAVPSDMRLNKPIAFIDPSGSYGSYVLPNDMYKLDLSEDITLLDKGIYSTLTGTYKNSFIRATVSFSNVKSVSNNSLTLTSSNLFRKQTSLPYVLPSILPGSPFGASGWRNTLLYHESGGNSSLLGLRERLSFAEIVNVIEGTSEKSKMNYVICSSEGITNRKNFTMKAVSPESITRIYDYYPVDDSDKPKEFYTFKQIGAVLEQQKDLQTLYRYQGNFSPKFRDVLKFWVREDNYFTDIVSRDFLLNNTQLGTNLNDFSILKNQYFSKVSDTEILRLSPESGYQPVYPLINEIAIEKKDQFAWSSTWDDLYYRKYTSVTDYESLNGTREMKEVKSLLGSKAMKVPKQFDLYQFEITPSSKKTISSMIENEFAYYEDSGNAYLQVNVYNKLLREMLGTTIDERARKEFINTKNTINGTFIDLSIEEYAKSYLEKNVLELFQIDEIKLYVLQTGNPGVKSVATITPRTMYRPLIQSETDIEGNTVTLSESSLFNNNYILKKDVQITSLGNMIFQIKYPLDTRFYTSLSIGVSVKRI